MTPRDEVEAAKAWAGSCSGRKLQNADEESLVVLAAEVRRLQDRLRVAEAERDQSNRDLHAAWKRAEKAEAERDEARNDAWSVQAEWRASIRQDLGYWIARAADETARRKSAEEVVEAASKWRASLEDDQWTKDMIEGAGRDGIGELMRALQSHRTKYPEANQ